MTAEELAAEAAAIQETVGQLEPIGRRRRYAPVLRERILRYLEAGVGSGRGRDELAVAAGVPAKTVDRWVRRLRGGRSHRVTGIATMVPVSLEAARSNAGLVVVTPGGMRLEGLDIDAAVSVLRALG